MDSRVIWRRAGFSRVIEKGAIRRVAWTLVFTMGVMLLTLCVGKIMLSPNDVLAALRGPDNAGIGFIVEHLRLPRMLLAALVGAALAVSGLILQSIVRNPLASPDLLGLSSGASASAVFYLAALAPSLGTGYLPIAAMLGAGAAAGIAYVLAWNQGVSPLRLVLIGVGVSAMLTAVTTFMLVFSPLATTLSAYVWLTGSVYGASWNEVRLLGMWLAGAWLVLVAMARHVGVQQLDDPLAYGIGVRVQAVRAMLLAASVALAGAAVAWGGAMAFVGLIAPHIARRIVLFGFAGQAVMAALVGANLVMLADLAGRSAFLPLDLPAGIFVAVFGTPYFLYLLIRQRQ